MGLFGGSNEYLIHWDHEGSGYFEDAMGNVFQTLKGYIFKYMTKEQAQSKINEYKNGSLIATTYYRRATDSNTMTMMSKKEIEKHYM